MEIIEESMKKPYRGVLLRNQSGVFNSGAQMVNANSLRKLNFIIFIYSF